METHTFGMGLFLEELQHPLGAQLGSMEARQVLEGPANKIKLGRLIELQISAVRNLGRDLDERLPERVFKFRH